MKSPFSFWKPIKSKKDLTYPQAKRLYPRLNPYGDADRDGVINKKDCHPFDKRRQDEKMSKEEREQEKKDREYFKDVAARLESYSDDDEY